METVIAQDANVNNVATPADVPNMLHAGKREIMIPLKRLVASPYNQRKKKRDQATIEAIADNMLAVGLLQNLVVHAMRKREKQAQTYGVDAGETRRLALLLNVERGKFSMDDEVRCIEISEADAILASASENDLRAPAHPADQFLAYKALADEGRTTEFVAAVFKVTPKMVAGYLKLASVSPKLFDLFADDQMSIDQIKALATTDDHQRQEAAWFTANNWSRDPHSLRNRLRGDKLTFGNRMVRFVTVAAYEAAGGLVERDLFANDDEGLIVNRDILDRLFDEKVAATVESYKAEGWMWVEARATFDYEEQRPYTTLTAEKAPLTDEQQAEYDKLEKRMGEIIDAMRASDDADEGEDAYLSDEAYGALERESDALNASMIEYDDREGFYTPEQMKVSGVVVTVNYEGKLQVYRALVRREDQKTARSVLEAAGAEVPRKLTKNARGVHSEKLILNMTARRTAAVRSALVSNADVALVATVHRLALQFIYERHSELSSVRICGDRPMHSVSRSAPEVTEQAQYGAFYAAVEAAKAQLPKNPNDLFAWLLGQPQAVVLNILAVCTAISLNGVSRAEEGNPINAIAGALELDLTKFWTPTRESYLSHVSKDRIVAVVSEVVSKEQGARLAKMKKGEAAQEAETLLADKNWLPEFMVAAEVATARTYFGDDDDDEEEDATQSDAQAVASEEAHVPDGEPEQDAPEEAGSGDAEPLHIAASADHPIETSVKKADLAAEAVTERCDKHLSRFAWPFPMQSTKLLTVTRPAA
ncbi:ParB/RepB/Spo0J family partition protein [Burkholderia cenocepacia]|uniref:ParB/RepB/Spo0J family partition protein n=1 Tax=Burkholderia cenocepacia TaxID=95486 RepID=UPI00196B3BEA|nr:ParB/RepB/Spo0J family partition protein [Burkholderia cenocepacia]MBN3506336.1 ParB/RepB/Spo0J family partition protein [Burkholderia cenocepacia]